MGVIHFLSLESVETIPAVGGQALLVYCVSLIVIRAILLKTSINQIEAADPPPQITILEHGGAGRKRESALCSRAAERQFSSTSPFLGTLYFRTLL